jgi:hypothetical protein
MKGNDVDSDKQGKSDDEDIVKQFISTSDNESEK